MFTVTKPKAHYKPEPDEGRPEWIEYPGGLKLASIPHTENRPCQSCGATFGQRHADFCQLAPCPKCGDLLVGCDCTDPLLAAKLYTSKRHIKRRINALASEYQGQPTELALIGSDDAHILAHKVAEFEKMVSLDKAANRILRQYTSKQLGQYKTSGQYPRVVEQAIIMQNQAADIWLNWFYR